MLERLAASTLPHGEESPGGGCYRESGRIASAWHRTAHSLKNMGLITISRYGDHYSAAITPKGRGPFGLGLVRMLDGQWVPVGAPPLHTTRNAPDSDNER